MNAINTHASVMASLGTIILIALAVIAILVVVHCVTTKAGAATGGVATSAAASSQPLNAVRSTLQANPNATAFVLVHSPGCGHCRTVLPQYEAMAAATANHPNVRMLTVNADTDPATTQLWNVTGLPTLLGFDASCLPTLRQPKVRFTGSDKIMSVLQPIAMAQPQPSTTWSIS